MIFIKQHIFDGVLHIALNRPDVHNAINLGMVDELQRAFTKAEKSDHIRVIVVSGVGDKSFSSGGDLIEFHAITTEAEAYSMMKRVAQLLHVIATSSKLTIAAINGYALGGGAELTTAFDLRIASDNAIIGFVQSQLGITTAWGGGTRLLSLLGQAKALPLLITGEKLPASEWVKSGYINHIYALSSFQEDSLNYVRKLVQRNSHIIRAYKRLAHHGMDTEMLHRSIEAEISMAAKLWVSEEHLQAANQFFEKNKMN